MSPSTLVLAEQFSHVVHYLEDVETEERLRALPHLVERAANVEIDDVQHVRALKLVDVGEDNAVCSSDSVDVSDSLTRISLRHNQLKEFSLALLNINSSMYTQLAVLDVSNNELTDLPGLAQLSGLTELSIQRNWFKSLPDGIGKLTKLIKLDASRNFLKPNDQSLRYDQLRSLMELKMLDLSYNRKFCRTDHRELIQNELMPREVEVLVTVWKEMGVQRKDDTADGSVRIDGCNNESSQIADESSSSNNNTSLSTARGSNNDESSTLMYIGASAAQRDAKLLRSQLEPWGTVNLRRRLVQDFGQEPSDPLKVVRAEVMERLLRCYQAEGLLSMDGVDSSDLNQGIGKRRVLRVDGTPVRQDLLDELLAELRSWRGDFKRGGSSTHRERPSIQAQSYMILRAPTTEEQSKGSRRAQRNAKKMERNQHLWELAMKAMDEVDSDFATKCTEIAVTYGFTGSPHIDKQNSTPFYGLSLGDFTEGTGCVSVECSARVLAEVNTKNRLGRVDGRYPHFVSQYNIHAEERFSLIYYETGGRYLQPGPAVFTVPHS